jgi:hypothetical protein
MDQGLAAVIAAVISGVVALGAIGSTIAVSQAGARSLRQQVLDQAAAEHAQWLREKRIQAFLDVRLVTSRLDTALNDLVAEVKSADYSYLPVGAEPVNTAASAIVQRLYDERVRELQLQLNEAKAMLSLTDPDLNGNGALGQLDQAIATRWVHVHSHATYWIIGMAFPDVGGRPEVPERYSVTVLWDDEKAVHAALEVVAQEAYTRLTAPLNPPQRRQDL